MQIQTRKYNYSYNSIVLKQPVISCSANKLSFSGFHSKDAKALFAFDLDGTFAHGTNEDIKKVLDLQKKANAVLVYVTGRTFPEVLKLQEKLTKSGIDLPMPEFLIANNGQFVYKNVDGKFLEDMDWRTEIKAKTGFDRGLVYNLMKKLSQTPKYLMEENKLNRLSQLEDCETRKKVDKDFWSSKISYYEFHPSEFGVEFIIDSKIKLGDLTRDIKNLFKENGIKNKFTWYKFDRQKVAMIPKEIRLKCEPLRANPKTGEVTALFLAPANKSDGVEYIRKKLGIHRNERLMAGDERNDYPLAALTKNGGFFVCVSNATEDFKNLVAHMKKSCKFPDNLIIASNEGAAGIAEGIEKVLKKLRPDLNL